MASRGIQVVIVFILFKVLQMDAGWFYFRNTVLNYSEIFVKVRLSNQS